MDKRKFSLYPKFNVSRTDGEDVQGHKHYRCEYFVLDLTHDPFALGPLRQYADECEREYPVLAADLRKAVDRIAESHNQPKAGGFRPGDGE